MLSNKKEIKWKTQVQAVKKRFFPYCKPKPTIPYVINLNNFSTTGPDFTVSCVYGPGEIWVGRTQLGILI